jgi:ribosomal-protein-alanine N-acetyltransferase
MDADESPLHGNRTLVINDAGSLVHVRIAQQEERLRIHIRWMIRRDMREVLGLEQEAFEFPWSDEDFTRCLRQRNCIGMVAESGESVVAFMIYELHRSRLHVLNFAVARSHRRLGIGTRMMEKLVGKLTPERRSRIVLEVRETNLPAQLFFRSVGFRAISVLKDFYQDTTEDAYLMHYVWSGAPAAATLPRRMAG